MPVSYTHLDVYKRQAVENSIANIREQIKSEVEQCMKIQPKQISEQTVPVIKTEKDTENKLIEKVTLPAVGTVHVKASTFDGSSHWATRQPVTVRTPMPN